MENNKEMDARQNSEFSNLLKNVDKKYKKTLSIDLMKAYLLGLKHSSEIARSVNEKNKI
jgi:hypothetical protein